MVAFCFDLTLAVLAHRHGRGPDFLIHDSHLFDGVDGRQLAAALKLAADVTREEELQYIATFNSDDLDKATGRGFDPHPLRTATSPDRSPQRRRPPRVPLLTASTAARPQHRATSARHVRRAPREGRRRTGFLRVRTAPQARP